MREVRRESRGFGVNILPGRMQPPSSSITFSSSKPVPRGSDNDFTGGFAVALVLGLLVAGAVWLLMRKRVLTLERTLANEKQKMGSLSPQQQIFVQSRADGEREDRERTIADLHIAKLRVELDLLNRQLANGHTDDDRLEASKEFHELMVEKTKLEIDSMRLHIAELRKRMDDFGV